METPHFGTFFLLEAILLKDDSCIGLAVSADKNKLLKMAFEVAQQFSGTFAALRVTEQGNYLELDKEGKLPVQTHEAPIRPV